MGPGLGEEEFSVPRGMRDIWPEEAAKRVWVAEKVRGVLSKYGFRIVEPSPVEALETLEAKSGPEIREQVYWFKDKAGRNIGLRFDLTVGMTRMVANRFDLAEPIKVGCVGGMWRYEEPQFARYRYFSQWDVEVYGVAEPWADAEIVAVGSEILESVGLADFEVRLSNRKLVEGFLRSLGPRSQAELERIMRVIDKLGRIVPGEAERDLSKAGLSSGNVGEVLRFCSVRGKPKDVLPGLEKGLPENELVRQGFRELAGTVDALGPLGRLSKAVVDLGVVRGIGYYDGMVFEAYDQAGADLGSIFGGGRFDKLCRVYGKRDMPATGVAGGIERLMLSLERKKLFPEVEQRVQVFVATVNEKVRGEAVRVVQVLRGSGVRADYDLKNRSLPRQLQYADGLGVRLSVILGPRELQEGKVRLKDMKAGTERDVSLSAVADEVLKILG